MSLHKLKSLTGVFIVLAFVSISVFGLFQFNHGAEMAMTDCPYELGSFSVCDSNLEHISHWQKFSNTTFVSFFILALLILGIILYFLSTQDFFDIHFYKWKFYLNKKTFSYSEKIIKWLSLFENSPPANTAFLYKQLMN